MGLGWENKGYWHIKGKECMIWIATRPHYCDRGNYLAHLEAKGHFARDVDEADGWPRYYFNFDVMKQEVESWLKTRKQYVDSNWVNDDGFQPSKKVDDEDFQIPEVPKEWYTEFSHFISTGNMSDELKEFLKNNPKHQGLVNFINEVHAEVFLEKFQND